MLTRELLDPSRAHFRFADRPRPVRTHIWEPAATAPPVVLLSHGTGGAAQDFGWLAEALAAAGFLVAGVDHHGNSYATEYLPQGFAYEWERPRDLSFVLNTLSRERPLGPAGAFGFSSGGTAAAALLGARFDQRAIGAVLDGTAPPPPIPEFPDWFDELRRAESPVARQRRRLECGGDFSDRRIRAALLVCPAIGQLLTPASLGAIDCPVRIWWGGADTITPPADIVRYYLDRIPAASGRSAGDQVRHHDFLPDRTAGAPIRRELACEAVRFFAGRLV